MAVNNNVENLLKAAGNWSSDCTMRINIGIAKEQLGRLIQNLVHNFNKSMNRDKLLCMQQLCEMFGAIRESVFSVLGEREVPASEQYTSELLKYAGGVLICNPPNDMNKIIGWLLANSLAATANTASNLNVHTEFCSSANCSCFMVLHLCSEALSFLLSNCGFCLETFTDLSEVFTEFITLNLSASLFTEAHSGNAMRPNVDSFIDLCTAFLNFIAQNAPSFADSPLSFSCSSIPRLFKQVAFDMHLATVYQTLSHFPSSEPALTDLANLLEADKAFSPRLLKQLAFDIETLVFNPGVPTAEVLSTYVQLVRGLSVLDKVARGYFTDHVVLLFQKYLRLRADAIRAVVQCLIDDPQILSSLSTTDQSDDFDTSWRQWRPEPRHRNLLPKGGDVVDSLVSIFGSRKAFAVEYTNLLAERLLTTGTSTAYPICEQQNQLDLLKRVVGDSTLSNCDVMLQDVSNSESFALAWSSANSTLLTEPGLSPLSKFPGINFSFLIISDQFWPPLKEENMFLPEAMESVLKSLSDAYPSHKRQRTIDWQSHLGSITLELEYSDGSTLELSAQPIYAVLLYQFCEKPVWNLKDLASTCQVPENVCRQRLVYWMGRQVIQEGEKDVFELVSRKPSTGASATGDVITSTLSSDGGAMEGEQSEAAMTVSVQRQKEQELQVFWLYVVGILTNLHSLSLERIVQMLRAFTVANNAPADMTPVQLKAFLESKVTAGLLSFSGGQYSLTASAENSVAKRS